MKKDSNLALFGNYRPEEIRPEDRARLKAEIRDRWLEEFTKWWRSCNKVGHKGPARAAWMKHQPRTLSEIPQLAQLIEDVYVHRWNTDWCEKLKKHNPHESTWLNREEFDPDDWEDLLAGDKASDPWEARWEEERNRGN